MTVVAAHSNLALGKTTWQSTTFRYNDIWATSWLAVDGNANPNFHNGHCTHTDPSDRSPWWMVDLAGFYNVQRVVVTNRGDNCCEYIDKNL